MFFPQSVPTCPLCISGQTQRGLVQQLWDLLWQVQEGHFTSLRSFQILSRTRGLSRLSVSVCSPSLFQLPKCL